MCLPIVAAAAAAGATLFSTIGKVQQANAQAAVADANANNEGAAAAQDQTSMNQAALTRYQQISQTEGQQRAIQAANGATVDYGSSGAQVQSTAVEGDLDVNRLYQTGFQAQRGHDANIANDLATASADRSQATMAGISGAFGAVNSFLGSSTQNGIFQSKVNGFGSGSTNFGNGGGIGSGGLNL